ncbi:MULTISPECIES: UvrD-helicase domain-containing protein [Bacillus cereus group]|uniref:UvrD/REP helicase n=1 Tax=Bacillus thuringiensis TaxID=1428 RepID=A0A1C4FBD8_BACTU|nr:MULTISPECIES: UvrD-helicase domain-containing protein [Bacillus cereus group]MED3023123.1 AAA family ATPase [Bacillus wiedmannii]OTX93766.1 DNA/RNA helicase [Bacillus thuringiensis serovar wratislaviensis]OUB63879.1 DNA/RNA helicase [Bacillus thuringiensis serovar sylvestriensis]SCC52975.1 UvrD/REP helicase [Bacillus thuringiensis]
MVKVQLEDEVSQIFQCIKSNQNFLLTGGAGSGKTYSLVNVIKKIIFDNPSLRISCITYTNTAVREIEGRINHENLRVSTIHDFLWDSIKNFQKEMKQGLIYLINSEDSRIKIPNYDELIQDSYFSELENGIQYKEYNQIKNGIISHDEVLELANYMFKTHPLLCDLLKDKYQFIFIDEYQDTSSLVIEIFLKHIRQGKKKNVIGFFGDSMQSIYDEGIGSLEEYILSGDVQEIRKKQNRRNPKVVIELANRLRVDKLIQEPSSDKQAPNMYNGLVKEGSIKFLYSAINDLELVKSSEFFRDWDFNNPKQTKELNLTHNLIAAKAGFTELMEIYDKDPIISFKNDLLNKIKQDTNEKKENILNDTNITFEEVTKLYPIQNKKKELKKELIQENPNTNVLYEQLKDCPFSTVKKIYLNKDALIDDKKQDRNDDGKKGSKRDNLIKHLFKIQTLIQLYKEKKYNDFIRKTEFSITSISKKREIKTIIDTIEKMSNQTIEKVINFAHESGLCRKDDDFTRFVEKNKYLFNRVSKVKYQEFQNLFKYLEGFTPFSTQHKIKGEEFDNVLVILDNGKWNKYNFEYLFCNRIDKRRVLERSQKIFYVCCTRAKENLIVFYNNPNDGVIEKAKEWFGENNVHRIEM